MREFADKQVNIMECEYQKIPKIVEQKEYYPQGANIPTQLTVYECFCGKGKIEYHRVPGFDDDWFVFRCCKCEKKYQPFIDQCGSEWKVYPL